MDELQEKYNKELEKAISLLKNNPNAHMEILQSATRLTYLRGRMFEKNKNGQDLEDLQGAFDVALEEINKLRKSLYD